MVQISSFSLEIKWTLCNLKFCEVQLYDPWSMILSMIVGLWINCSLQLFHAIMMARCYCFVSRYCSLQKLLSSIRVGTFIKSKPATKIHIHNRTSYIILKWQWVRECEWVQKLFVVLDSKVFLSLDSKNFFYLCRFPAHYPLIRRLTLSPWLNGENFIIISSSYFTRSP